MRKGFCAGICFERMLFCYFLSPLINYGPFGWQKPYFKSFMTAVIVFLCLFFVVTSLVGCLCPKDVFRPEGFQIDSERLEWESREKVSIFHGSKPGYPGETQKPFKVDKSVEWPSHLQC